HVFRNMDSVTGGNSGTSVTPPVHVGIFDIDEMEAAGVDPKVQVVVQAEFSPTQLAQYKCGASCFNRPNFNTFRYAITGQGTEVNGPNGAAEDIGNVNMTDPAQLQAFINWGKQKYPARKYMVVLWNHGGGYVGLLQDETSAGSKLMSLEQLKTGLSGVGPIDVVDFDMCLMAGYETLVKLNGLAKYAVFSEEIVPGEGNPYTSIIDGIQANPTMDGRGVAGLLVDRFDAAYQGNKASTTKSAYDLGGLPGFETALGAFATQLRQNVGAMKPTIAEAAITSQKFAYPELTDVVSFLDSLDTRVQGNAGLRQSIAALRTAALSPSFRINNKARRGSGNGQQLPADVRRATGLHIVLPSGMENDVFADQGQRSLASYQTLYAGGAWTSFLTDYTNTQGTTAVTDQGDQRFESYLVWDEEAIEAEADVDLWILEPDGNIYIPAFGSVSQNGTFSSASEADGVNFEGYLTNRFVQNGQYRIFANLWDDPQDFQPRYDLAYRFGQYTDFDLLFNPDFPRLSLESSWLDDEDPTLEEIDAGAYTDLQAVATLNFGQGATAGLVQHGKGGWGTTARVAGEPRLTAAQLQTLKRVLGTTARAQARFKASARVWKGAFPAIR
ncbi:MAG: clostripain-related cysteine peptidase, partial [Gemmatimonadota bacterium]